MSFFMITPYATDPLFLQKKQIIEKISAHYKLEYNYAPINLSDSNIFDIDKTIKLLGNVDFVIADVSYERPSCYFEIGFVQALNKKVYLIATENSTLHQLLNRNEMKFYNNMIRYEELINSILDAQSIIL
jgi:nucleoside 2-deoxyribosyltransferase